MSARIIDHIQVLMTQTEEENTCVLRQGPGSPERNIPLFHIWWHHIYIPISCQIPWFLVRADWMTDNVISDSCKHNK